MTYDNGVEMTNHKITTRHTSMQIYFESYLPRESGTNEITTDLIRKSFS